jgi:hypothetical protein
MNEPAGHLGNLVELAFQASDFSVRRVGRPVVG